MFVGTLVIKDVPKNKYYENQLLTKANSDAVFAFDTNTILF